MLKKIAESFQTLLSEIQNIVPEGRQMSIVKTKLE